MTAQIITIDNGIISLKNPSELGLWEPVEELSGMGPLTELTLSGTYTEGLEYRFDLEMEFGTSGTAGAFYLETPSTDVCSSGFWSISNFTGSFSDGGAWGFAEVKNGNRLSGRILIKGRDLRFAGQFGLGGANAGTIGAAGRIDGTVDFSEVKIVSEIADRITNITVKTYKRA